MLQVLEKCCGIYAVNAHVPHICCVPHPPAYLATPAPHGPSAATAATTTTRATPPLARMPHPAAIPCRTMGPKPTIPPPHLRPAHRAQNHTSRPPRHRHRTHRVPIHTLLSGGPAPITPLHPNIRPPTPPTPPAVGPFDRFPPSGTTSGHSRGFPWPHYCIKRHQRRPRHAVPRCITPPRPPAATTPGLLVPLATTTGPDNQHKTVSIPPYYTG